MLDRGVDLAEQGDLDGARAAFQVVIDSNHPDASPVAALNLGLLHKQQGDPEGARAVFQLAIDSTQPEAGPAAACNLGALAKEQGDLKVRGGHSNSPSTPTTLSRLREPP